MDYALDQITDFATRTRPSDVPAKAIELATDILLDSIACAMAGRDCPGARTAEAITDLPRGTGGTVIGRAAAATLEMAAFWNTSMIRYADYNDSLTAGHPSDMLGALIAVAGARQLSGRTLLSGIAVAYEVFHLTMLKHRSYHKHKGALVDNLSIDQGFFVAVSAAAGIAHMLGYDRTQTRTAVSLAATAGLPLRASRAGELSHYKGVATAVSSRQAVFSCQLAEQNLTGPSDPFEGRHGYIEIMEGKAGPMNLERFGDWAVVRTNLKFFPATQNCQLGIWAALKLREEIDTTQLRDVVLHVSRFLWHESGSEPAKWTPTTHETADHSLPYTFSVALMDGWVTLDSYNDDRLANPALRDLMQKVSVKVDDEIEAVWPSRLWIRAIATLADGTTREVDFRDPKGTFQNPMSREDIRVKFRQLGSSALGPRADKLFDLCAGIAEADNCKAVFDQLIFE